MFSMLTVNTTLVAAIVISLLVWLLQESLGRHLRIGQLSLLGSKALTLGVDAGFPVWLRGLSWLMMASWLALVAVIYQRRDADFALTLVALVLFSGVVVLVDRLFFRQRRVQLTGAASVQQVLSRQKTEPEKQLLLDWAESDFTVAEYAKSFFPVLLVVLLLRSFLMEPFKIPSASMVPTLQVHDFILVNKFAYGLRLPVLGTKLLSVGEPQRGDVMVFFPPNDKRYFIKRVIGLPGDEVSLRDKQLYINGVKMEQTPLPAVVGDSSNVMVLQENLQWREHLIQHNVNASAYANGQVVVPSGHYFMMGDNRDNSLDSRAWGMVPEDNIVGRAVYVWMHWGAWFSLPSFSRNGVIE